MSKTKTVVLSLTFLASCMGLVLLFIFDTAWETIVGYIVLMAIMILAIGVLPGVLFAITYTSWSKRQPRAVLTVDGIMVKIRYSRLDRRERLVLTGPKSDVIYLNVVRAPIAESIEMALGERSLTGQKEHQAMLEIEGEVFEFPMFEWTFRCITLGGLHILQTIYSGYFHREKDLVHFVGEVKYCIYHELETSDIIILNQNS